MDKDIAITKSQVPEDWTGVVRTGINACDEKGGTIFGDRLIKEELSKLSDSACESLNESEESGSKYQENVLAGSSSSDVVARLESEVDSLECEDDGDLYESEEESVDNNTFNIVNTENSESQEISELTNEDSTNDGKHKENETQSTSSQGETQENNDTQTHDTDGIVGDTLSSETKNDSVSEDEEEEESEEYTEEDGGEFDDSLDEEETSHSKLTDDPSLSEGTQSKSEVRSKIKPKQAVVANVNKIESNKEGTIPKMQKTIVNTVFPANPVKHQSPKIKKRCGIPVPHNKNNKNDFIIEIFESKRKPDISTISDTSDKCEKINKLETKVLKNLDNLENLENVLENNLDKSLDSSLSSDYKQLTQTMDSLSPESIDKTSSILLDISQVIKEENEDSGDALSPLKSLVVDDTLNSTNVPPPTDFADTSKKHPESSKYRVSPSADSKTSPFNSVTSTSESSACERGSDSPKNNDTSSNQNDAPIATTKPTPMAFTVELGDSAASDSSGSGSTGKKLDISASISQWAPKHRRNLSLTKVDEHKVMDFYDENGNSRPRERRSTISRLDKIEERQNCDKPPLGRPRAGTVGAGSLSTRKGGYHSEGYFSSDQDEEGTKRIDLKSPRSPRANESVKSPLSLVRTSSQESPKDNSVRMRPPSPVSSPSSPYAVPLNESASVLIEKMLNATPETKRKFNSKPEGRSCCKERERKPSVSELTGKSYIKAEKDSKMGTDSKNQARNTPTDDIDAIRDDKDDVSEAGTYTIDKDSPSPETDQAREDIDHVFGVPNESEAEMTSTTAVPMSTTCPEDESSWLSASEMAPTISRNSPNWIQQWAAQVAEQTKPVLEPISPHCKPSLQSPRVGHKLALSSQESNDSRPRRKLPTPPSHLSKQCNSPRAVDISDSENSKNRYWRDSMVSSDLTSDTEAFLRDTENIVTSLQARVDKTRGTNPAFRNSSFESHESGGDSDLDTSTSYQFRDDEKLSASIRSKLRLTGLHPSSKNLPSPLPVACSPRRTDGGTIGDPRLLNREATYDLYPTRREECAVLSDSSSETSEPYKDPPPRTIDNNPPLKFNRAFSLRRARLGCDEPVLPMSTEKKKLTRPSSAGAVSSGRTKASLGATKSYQSVDNPSVSSPRNYGFGSPRGIASSSLNVVSKVTSSSSDNFDRTDGGRFSLRLPRSVGPSAIGVLKSPSKTNFHKRDSSTSNSKKNALRSNSTLTSKEVDFQNWKRRKNYDPMKAAAEGRKKQGDQKVKNTPEQPAPISDARSPSPLGSLLRSASFHGTEGGMGNMRWNKRGNPPNQAHYTSEDDGPYSLEEEFRHNPSPRHGSPLRRSPTSPHQLCQSPARQSSSSVSRARRPSSGPAEEGEVQYQASSRKISLDETGSEGKRSPMNGVVRGVSVSASSSGGCGGGRPKTKMEALDNLVISTIHSLSVKVRTTSESLLQKLKSQYDEEGDRAALLEEVLSHLSESDQSLTSGQTRSTSRELAGILRNLKKIEHALGVIDRVIIVGDDDYQDDDDLLDEVPQDWVESDY